MEWKPATRDAVKAAVRADWIEIDPALQVRLAAYLVEPQPASIKRFNKLERAFIVARSNSRVVFFDDVEDDFWIGREADGLLTETTDYGHLAVALQELERLRSNAG